MKLSVKRYLIVSLYFGVHLMILKSNALEEIEFSSTSPSPSPFSSYNFIVRFNPYVALNDTSKTYDDSDLVRMLGLISTQFSSVVTPRIGVKDVVSSASLSLVASSVAKFNSKYEGGRGGHIKVFMTFGDINEEDVSEINLASFDVALQVAKQANDIHYGTVEYFLTKPKKLGDFNKDQVLREITNAKNTSRGMPYKLGGIFPFTACGVENVTVPEYLKSLVGHLGLAVFSIFPTQEDYNNGVEITFSSYIQQFHICKEILKEVAPELEVGFRTSWSDTDHDGNKNASSQVAFWMKMNNWAIMTQTKIFFLEAFDVPSRKGNDRFKGWWKLISKRPLGDDLYEDKLGNKFNLQPRIAKPSDGGRSYLSAILIGVFTFLGFLAVMGIILFVIYRKVAGKIKYGPYQLTNEEVHEFFEGSGPTNSQSVSGNEFQLNARRGSVDELICSVNAIAYNKEYELDKKSFVIDEDSTLGSGNFGIVCLGKVLKDSGEIEVAVKMLKTGGPKTGLKGLLSETKLQSRLGKHENVVSLIGAYTAELKRGSVFVFTELCEVGSLEKYLKKCYVPRYSKAPEKNIENEMESSFTENIDVELNQVMKSGGVKWQPQLPDAGIMFRWAYEIACGMEFLASKKVVHADLASRNVLLTRALTAKISDFGLSRRLYDYTSYIKSEPEPLPWAWMAPESLRRMEFNEKTDVWAYGVTLWEIYSLGEKPYPGLTWSWDFSARLIDGLRPGEPEYNSNDMYTKMLKCWCNDPAKRPSFKELRREFNSSNDNDTSDED